jgi:hypothetical protein
MDSDQIRIFLSTLGDRYPHPAQLVLLGGSALCLLGSPRPTLDIDYVEDDLNKNDLQRTMEELAHQMGLDVEAVPIDRFIPLPAGGHERNFHFGNFGKIEVTILDPYSIALSKIDRGFDTDIDDVVFLIHRRLVELEELDRILDEALSHAHKFDMNPSEIIAHLQEVKSRLK